MSRHTVRMSREKYIAEHVELVDALKHPTPKKLKAEAKEQAKDLKMAKKTNPGPKYEPKGKKEEGKKHEMAETKSFEKKEHAPPKKGKK